MSNSWNKDWEGAYKSWISMHSTIDSIKEDVDIDPLWATEFKYFKRDMGERPKDHYLARIDKEEGFFKENCEWRKFYDSTNILGHRFGQLVAIKEAGIDRRGPYPKLMILCRCDCGREKAVRSSSLTFGHTKTCGEHRRITQIGSKYGKLTVMSEPIVKEVNGGRVKFRKVKCDCGNEKVIREYNIGRSSNSCGCMKKYREQFI